jgi:hypothetical protein
MTFLAWLASRAHPAADYPDDESGGTVFSAAQETQREDLWSSADVTSSYTAPPVLTVDDHYP